MRIFHLLRSKVSSYSGCFGAGFSGLSECGKAWRGLPCSCRLAGGLVLVLGRVISFRGSLGQDRQKFFLAVEGARNFTVISLYF